MTFAKAAFSALAILVAITAHAEAQTPKLVIQITVDGLRGDLLKRYKPSFVEGGFRHLMEQGV